MNDRTEEACTNAKADDIQVYTIAFEITSSSLLQMMENCATEPSMAYDANSNAALAQAFGNISSEISQLRLAQ